MLNPKSMMAPSPAKSRDTGYIGSKFVGAGAAAKKPSPKPMMAKPTMPMKNPISSLVGARPTPIIGQGSIGGAGINRPMPATRPVMNPLPMTRPEAPPQMPPMQNMNPAIMGGPAPIQRPMMPPNSIMAPGGGGVGGLGAYMRNKQLGTAPIMY